ncbi:MAG: hypothetical protein GEU79_00635 [Acidimicrobiia bacterium]|nr:hypothetical protein [Acidimicrobiia bacterium]
MGEGLVVQLELMDGMQASVIADVDLERARAAFRSAGVYSPVEADDIAAAAEAVGEGRRVITTDATLAAAIPNVDAVVEATGVPEVGAVVALGGIEAGNHVLQMNVETDATVGWILRTKARQAGVVYTLTVGDEPGATMDLYDDAVSLGFEVICAGKGKNNPLDRTANPETLAESARSQMMNPKMLASFVDGTKTMVEMTSLANAIGFVPDVLGMHGPDVTPATISDVYRPATAGGILGRTGVVEYGLGIAPGVFVVFTTDHPKILRDLTYLSLGEGPYFALYRPYHLTSLETPISLARAVLDADTTAATDNKPTAETVATAKKDLARGDVIDGLGGFSVYGLIERADTARSGNLLPLGLAPGATVAKAVTTGEILTYDHVEVDESKVIRELRTEQDAM